MKTYTLTSVRESGSSVRVELLASDGEVMRHRMTAKIWESFCFSKGDALSKEDYLKIADISERCEAVTKALRLLSSRTLSCKKLSEKLIKSGISEKAANDAVAVALRKGLIDEEVQAEEYAVLCAERKLRGRARISANLISHGYPADISKRAAEKVPASIYGKALRTRLAKSWPDGIPTERAEREKMIASLVRQGFSLSEILSVIEE